LLVVLSAAIGAVMVIAPTSVPVISLAVPLLLASLWLAPRQVPGFLALLVLVLGIALLWQPITFRTVLASAILVLLCAIVLVASVRRSRLGVAGLTGESMFVDLRDGILKHGGIPDLPRPWHVESALHSAGGTPFAGDFVVATRPTPNRFELAVVDVSGKGVEAGTRALLLSGAFGGLLGALPAAQFLPAANEYVLRQHWEEGFATAVHLSLNLVDATYEVRTAGHPPAVRRAAGSGRWSVLPSSGPILGLLQDAQFVCASGSLAAGDAMLLYTDGMVERPRHDIDQGLDRLLGKAERLVRGDFTGASDRLVEAIGTASDDRAVVVVTRS
jgi:Stage II sporulation protein E (SpoIIE)